MELSDKDVGNILIKFPVGFWRTSTHMQHRILFFSFYRPLKKGEKNGLNPGSH